MEWGLLGIVALIVFSVWWVLAPFIHGEVTTYDRWYVYHNNGQYQVNFLTHFHVPVITKTYEVNGVEFMTSSKEEACQIASMLNSIEEMNIVDAEAAEWHRVKC